MLFIWQLSNFLISLREYSAKFAFSPENKAGHSVFRWYDLTIKLSDALHLGSVSMFSITSLHGGLGLMLLFSWSITHVSCQNKQAADQLLLIQSIMACTDLGLWSIVDKISCILLKLTFGQCPINFNKRKTFI